MFRTKPLVALVLSLLAFMARAEEPSPDQPALSPAAPRIPPAFFEQYLSYDRATGHASIGRERRPLTHTELFMKLGRSDLIERSESMKRRRTYLAVGAGAAALSGVGLATVIWGRLPDLNSNFCTANHYNYNEICVPRYRTREAGAGIALVSGLTLGGILATLAYWSNPRVLSADEALALISQHNAALLKQTRDGQSDGTGHRLQLTPYASTQEAGLLTTFTF